MMTKDTVGVRVFKHGLCAVTMAVLLATAGAMIGQVFHRTVAEMTMQYQNTPVNFE
jgi:hypothetical protein